MKLIVTPGTPADKPLVPKYIRIPAEGKADPLFGCPRQKYLQLERDGVLKLIRLVTKGKRRGIVLIPVEQMQAYLEKLQP
jgi:hypothetical protein